MKITTCTQPSPWALLQTLIFDDFAIRRDTKKSLLWHTITSANVLIIHLHPASLQAMGKTADQKTIKMSETDKRRFGELHLCFTEKGQHLAVLYS